MTMSAMRCVTICRAVPGFGTDDDVAAPFLFQSASPEDVHHERENAFVD